MDAVDLCPVATLLSRGGILYGVPAADKMAAITASIERLTLPAGVSRDRVIEEILRRENVASTATGDGLAIPHPQNAPSLGLPASVLSLAFLDQPIDFDAPDGQPVYALFVLLSQNAGLHLRLLAHLGRTLQRAEVRDALSRRLPAEQIIEAFSRAEASISGHRPAPPAAVPVAAVC